MSSGDRGSPTWRRATEWALVIIACVVLWLGPPILFTIYSIAVGVFILVRGPQWQRLWLATSIGVVLVAIGIVGGLVLLIG